ncbi:rCG42680 [Rattus norvegicus]|uniref:RCG42680 n=1 Tax=Rattus norvegicus TaxID=10116 RepID=A6K172_RAT|nr:rCG42680 [Rattus norvegicus]
MQGEPMHAGLHGMRACMAEYRGGANQSDAQCPSPTASGVVVILLHQASFHESVIAKHPFTYVTSAIVFTCLL